MQIRAVEQRDSVEWERMRQLLWPAPKGEHASETQAFFSGPRDNPVEVFVAFDDAGRALGFAELAIRPYAEGCHSRRVAYLEGWYVDPHARGTGVGGALVRAVEDWGRSQGCTELASDTEIENEVSAAAHRALGFSEAARIVCYRKSLV